MGEYAKFGGAEIKIGTCEDMYYLRADQRHRVSRLPGNVDPMDLETLKVLRFRFPWPDEDGIEPGSDKFHDNGHERTLGVHGVKPPDGVDHHGIQFSANHPKVGLLVSLPCPNGKDGANQPYTIHRNGYSGDVAIVGTAWRNGEWRVILQCGACGAKYNAPREHAAEVAAALRASVREDDASFKFFNAVADRMLAGYNAAEVGA